MWTKQALHDLIETKLRDYQFIVVTNRELFNHGHIGKRIEGFFPASRMATADRAGLRRHLDRSL